MLQTVKNCISTLSTCSFSEHYIKYIMQVQDDNLDEELRYLQVSNVISPVDMYRIIDEATERMKSL